MYGLNYLAIGIWKTNPYVAININCNHLDGISSDEMHQNYIELRKHEYLEYFFIQSMRDCMIWSYTLLHSNLRICVKSK